MQRKDDDLAVLDHALWSCEIYRDEYAETQYDFAQSSEEIAELYAMRRHMLHERREKLGKKGDKGT